MKLKYTPIVICGMGRSGTRNVADNITKHPKVQVYGEIPPKIMDSFLDFYSVANSSYERSIFKEGWRKRKEDLFFDCINNISKEKIDEVKPGREYVGYKSPGHEKLFRKIEKCFHKEDDVKPVYIYCVRDALSCWKSYKSMEWNRLDIDSFIEEYISSFDAYLEMVEKCEERVVVFNLNEYVKSSNKSLFFKENILMGIGMKENEIEEFEHDARNRNATVKVTGSSSESLPDSEKKLIKSNKKINSINKHFRF